MTGSFLQQASACAGLGVVFGILVGEWVLFLVLAWYLEQVLPSGAGVRRKPLFFLDRWRRQPSAAVSGSDSLVCCCWM